MKDDDLVTTFLRQDKLNRAGLFDPERKKSEKPAKPKTTRGKWQPHIAFSSKHKRF